MNSYLITSPRFSGEAELIYNLEGVLMIIDCSQTSMHPETLSHFKRAVPVLENNLSSAFTGDTIVVQKDYVITFEMFWKKYNHKFNKDRSEGVWTKLSKSDQILAYFGLDKYHKFLRKNTTHLKLHPDTYLRNKAWLNDYR